MSSWRYQIMRHTADSGEDFLGVHEFYTMHDGKLGWTAKPILIEADSLPEMRQALLAILTDIERHGVRDARTGEIVQAGESG